MALISDEILQSLLTYEEYFVYKLWMNGSYSAIPIPDPKTFNWKFHQYKIPKLLNKNNMDSLANAVKIIFPEAEPEIMTISILNFGSQDLVIPLDVIQLAISPKPTWEKSVCWLFKHQPKSIPLIYAVAKVKLAEESMGNDPALLQQLDTARSIPH
ncbi:uncharacterized protein SAPINGB_P005124 [Magnusiomyces paraingens]|uniref:Uncharacterized protein n=1 Tax=Magnusiomyces paraingens TaxID=2606893 RepID=A0A5E8BYE5_9ASCO|nr:uncharacterized protein SAPINGB_P005124 [Saprochaete ingens]VVT56517.1 unnamed protein product [Saprochaete ingens]